MAGVHEEGSAPRLLWKVLRPVLVWIISLTVIAGLIVTFCNYVNAHYLLPPVQGDSEPVVFTVESGSSLTTIARKLEEEGLIRNHTVFRYLGDFRGISGSIQAGTYRLQPSMTMDEIMAILASGSSAQTERRITLQEGMTCEEMADYLVSVGALATNADFLACCRDAERFSDYYIVETVINSADSKRFSARKYPLEGLLAPDTYDIFINESAESIIRRLLTQSGKILTANKDVLDEAADGLTLDETYILASIIEREAKPDDYAKVSAILHERLRSGDKLMSRASVRYALGTTRLALTNEELNTDSPFNTCRSAGLPAGAIGNPSKAALLAAAQPDTAFAEEGYRYFVCTDPESGALTFCKTQKEYEAAISAALPVWQAWDAAHQ